MNFLQPVQYLLDPWLFMATSACYLPPTIICLVRSRRWTSLFHWSQFKQVWFASFWRWAGPQVRTGSESTVVALLQGRTCHGRILEEGERKKYTPPISGIVVEIGSGSGMWVPIFGNLISQTASSSKDSTGSSISGSRHRKSSGSANTSGNITKIYGVEPNTSVLQALKEQVVAAGLEDVYEILPMGIEDLAKSGKIARASIDCAVCILCLCGIPKPQDNICELYGYLKPGGRMYVYEHVRCSRHWTIVWYQRFLNTFWPQMIGGCQLLRNTGQYLRDAGPWTSIDLAQPMTEPWYHAIPHLVGVLTK